MSADASSRAKHQFLEEDFQLLQQLNAHDEKQPFVLGICLGAQLMTWAFGGTVAEGEKMLAGWNEIEILSTHPAFDGLVRPLQCEIHYNHIERLPKDADIVATSLCDNVEAFAIGTQFLGVGYHPEVTAEDMSFISKTYGIRFENLCSTTKGAKEAFEASQRFFENIRSLI